MPRPKRHTEPKARPEARARDAKSRPYTRRLTLAAGLLTGRFTGDDFPREAARPRDELLRAPDDAAFLADSAGAFSAGLSVGAVSLVPAPFAPLASWPLPSLPLPFPAAATASFAASLAVSATTSLEPSASGRSARLRLLS